MVVSIVHGSFNVGHAFFAYKLGLAAATWSYSAAVWAARAITLGGALLLGVRQARKAV